MKIIHYAATFFSLLILSVLPSKGQIKLPRLISDGMVLQRDTQLKIWGWASENEVVNVEFAGQKAETRADATGAWEVELNPLAAGGPFAMTVRGKDTVRVNDILIGEVWVCSGQSNMEINMQRASPLYGNEIAEANYPEIRYFEVPKTYSFGKQYQDLEGGEWQKTDPEGVLSFSAVGYFFAKNLHELYNVPVGIVLSALGGSPAQAWISEESLKGFDHYYQEALKFKKEGYIDSIRQSDQMRSNNWYAMSTQKDLGNAETIHWSSTKLDTKNWKAMNIPGYWADGELGQVNGVVWFRKEINLSEKWEGQSAKLLMGRIVDADSTFVNGTYVGRVTYQYPPRRYEVPAGVLKAGKNTVTVRVINNSGRGGFVEDKPYQLSLGDETIDLKGEWKYRLGCTMEPLAPQTFIRWKSSGLYNAMVAPLLNYTMKGVLWYQGESNASRNAAEYDQLLPTLITDWRNSWQMGDFPFLYVQLPNFMSPQDQPSESNWARLREAQLKTLSTANTGMAVAIDLGEWNDIHPLNKKHVADRLALTARKVAYAEDLAFSGPLYRSMKIEKGKIRLVFDHVNGGLMARGKTALTGFEIAGEDKQFKWAKAKIDGDQVVVWSDDVKSPVAVRYAWANNPHDANLYNHADLPASPFRTDAW